MCGVVVRQRLTELLDHLRLADGSRLPQEPLDADVGSGCEALDHSRHERAVAGVLLARPARRCCSGSPSTSANHGVSLSSGRGWVPPGVDDADPHPAAERQVVGPRRVRLGLVGHLGLDGRADPAAPDRTDVQPVVGRRDELLACRLRCSGRSRRGCRTPRRSRSSASRTRGCAPSARAFGKREPDQIDRHELRIASGSGGSVHDESACERVVDVYPPVPTRTRNVVGVVEEPEVGRGPPSLPDRCSRCHASSRRGCARTISVELGLEAQPRLCPELPRRSASSSPLPREDASRQARPGGRMRERLK